MMNAKQSLRAARMAIAGCTIAAAVLAAGTAAAQTLSSTTNYTENFTGSTTNNSWYFSNGACLTASTSAGSASPGQIPGCTTMTGAGGYYAGDTLVGGNTGRLPDSPSVGGALRFTNNNNNQHGAIISNFTFPLSTQGIKVTFTTETYEGDSGGSGGDGADGISFFLQDASQVNMTNPVAASATGDFGGSLAYTCSNVNNDPTNGYNGIVGGYLGLGIDEYGNFLNQGDNTSTGWGYQWNRIGLRGAGSTAWSWLNLNYAAEYPATLSSSQQGYAVQKTCQTGYVWDYSDPDSPIETPIKLPNYTAIPGAYKVLSSSFKIANESARYRGYGTTGTTGRYYGVPITYNLTITPAGLLSLSYSYNGGAFQPVITGQNITASNGPIPPLVRFGFAGSDGGSTNIHEIMCFQASPQNQSQSSAGLNQKQTAKVQTGTQVYFAYYNANNWTGSLTSQYLDTPTGSTSSTALQIDPVVNWDASCVLTGVLSGQTCATTGAVGPIAAEGPTSRTILSWNGSSGIPFEWSNLSAAEQAALDTADPSPLTANRLNYLRGDRSNEQPPTGSTGTEIYRARTSVLGDIIDSSPTWVGPPSSTFPTVWKDDLNVSATMPENSSGAETYANFMSTYQTRTNVVYAGANDGLLHGFRTGSFDSSGNYVSTTNDGYELLAFMPGYVVDTINAGAAEQDYSNPLYAHQFSVDAPPGVGDLFYGNQWHTWLVGGLGPGGSAIYALDITNPANFAESNAASTVIGEWSTTTVSGTTTSTLSCPNTANCGNHLGNTYGDPQIRRFHNGAWGAVFGNGIGSATGDAGIYVMSVDPTTGAQTFYYLSTGVGSPTNPNGIAYVTAADLDGDHVVDYVYAGDLQGNVWRFNLTSSDPTQWTVSPAPMYTTPAGQPITTRLIVALVTTGGSRRVLVEFGTGQQTPLSTTSPSLYATSQQALYGIWDWNMAAWNAQSPVQYASLPSTSGTAAPTSPISGTGSLEQQTITATYDPTLVASSSSTTPTSAYYYRTLSSNTVCWADTTGCNQFGWYLNLTSGYANPTDPNGLTTSTNTQYPTVYEQVIFNPVLEAGAFIVNTTIPPTNSLSTCAATPAAGWTMAVNPATGGAFPNSFFGDANHNFLNVDNQAISGIALSGTGSPSFVTKGTMTYMVTQTVSGTGVITAVNPQGGTKSTRLTWIEKR